MTDYTEAISRYYGPVDISARIIEKLEQAGKAVQTLTRDDIALFDEFHGGGRRSTRRLAEWAQLAPGTRVLDVGCGVGGPARTLAAEFGCRVTGVDLTEEFCRAADMLTRMVGLGDDVRFQHADALNMPFEDASFDAVWTQNTMMNIKDQPGLFKEISRVLRPGGRFVFETVMAGSTPDIHFPVFWADSSAINFLYTPQETRAMLDSAGLRETVWNDVTEASIEMYDKFVTAIRKKGPPPLGIGVIVPRDALQKMRNILRNLEEERLTAVHAIYTKP